jgi:membrane protein DedA with SNARE-associated domain
MPGLLEHWGYAGLLVALILGGLGLPIPEDVPLLISGYLLHQGTFKWPATLAVALAGVLTADSMIYALGARSRQALGRTPRWMPISMEQLERARIHFARRGVWTVVGARFTPGLRLMVHWSAGALGMSYFKFVFSDAMSALVSVPVWLLFGFLAASHLDRILRGVAEFEHVAGAILIAIILAVGIVVWWRNQGNRSRSTSQNDKSMDRAEEYPTNMR